MINPITKNIKKVEQFMSWKWKITFARGARQLVVQLALDITLRSDVYSFSLTPTTNMGASLLGAEMITFFAPPCIKLSMISSNECQSRIRSSKTV